MEPINYDIVNKIPNHLFFSALPDRQQVLKYINYLFSNVPESKTLPQDMLYREVISKHLRIINMKVIEPEIFLCIALTTITIDDFTIPSDMLIKKVISENPDDNDLDLLYRVLSQVMSKISKDLKERITNKQKLQILHLVNKAVKIDKSVLERFISGNASLNTRNDLLSDTPITMELDKNDYNTLNEKYLKELYKFEKQHKYLNSNSLEYGGVASKMYQTSSSISNSNSNSNRNSNSNNIISNAQYIDKYPDLMLGTTDNILYYYDASSGALSEIPITSNQQPVSIDELKTILVKSKIKQQDIDNTINLLKQPQPTQLSNAQTTTTEPQGILNKLTSLFKSADTSITQPIITQPPHAIQIQNINNTKLNNTKLNNAKLDNTPIPPSFLKKLYNKNNLQNQQDLDANIYENLNRNMQQSSQAPHITKSPYNIIRNETNSQARKVYQSLTSENFDNFKNNNTNININTNTSATAHTDVMTKIKHSNKKIENIALGFITSIVLCFIAVIYNSSRQTKK